MNVYLGRCLGDFNDFLLPSQYNDLIRRRSPVLNGEYRLLWAVLEEALRSYLANMACSTRDQRIEFKELRSWFYPAKDEPQDLFAFTSICEIVGIDPDLLRRGLESLSVSSLSMRCGRMVSRSAKSPRLAA
jgi:hypothetical protein